MDSVRLASRTMPYWFVAATLAGLGAGPPEIVRVKVPSTQVSNWFPSGSDLQILPLERFEAMVKAARDRLPEPRSPRLLKARHSARWEEGRLIGRTELTVEVPPNLAPRLLLLEPWSPGLNGDGEASRWLRMSSDGQLALKVEPGSGSKFEFGWILRSRPGSEGLAFVPSFPEVEVASLSLDLPSELVPEGTRGIRLSPQPSPSPDRNIWRFDAVRGRLDIRLRNLSVKPDRVAAPRLWLEGKTEVDLRASPINWRAEWILDESPGSPRQLTIELDPSLEFVDVLGPRVAGFRYEHGVEGSRLSIRLDGEGSGTSPLTIRAICKPPVEGFWPVPSARPLDATWTGGRTSIRLDSGRVLQASVERSGRRVAPRPGDLSVNPDLVFESKGLPGPVAELTFRKPKVDATVQVRGLYLVGKDSTKIVATLTWTIEKGKPLGFAADLPPGWSPTEVTSAAKEPVAWHVESLGNGWSRIHLGPPTSGESNRPFSLTLSATEGGAGLQGPLGLPRIRPFGVRVVDEIWVAAPESGLILRPISGEGLAWLEPRGLPIGEAPAPWSEENLKKALAWRWLVDAAEASIVRVPTDLGRSASVELLAKFRPGRLSLEWSINIDDSRGGREPILFHLDESAGGLIHWHSREPGNPIVESSPMAQDERASAGFPTTGQAWKLTLPDRSNGKIRLLGRVERPWAGRGRIPLLTLPGRERVAGLVTLVAGDSTLVKVTSQGMTAIAGPEDPVKSPEGTLSPGERKSAFLCDNSSVQSLEVETTEPSKGPIGGFIREASLSTRMVPGVGMSHRLDLILAMDAARAIELTMPGGVSVDSIRRDGVDALPTISRQKIRIEVPRPSPGRALCTLSLAYRTSEDPRKGPIEPRRLLPECSLPCLSFAWEVILPVDWSLEKVDPGLKLTDFPESRTRPAKIFGPGWSSLWDRGGRTRRAKSLSMLANLEHFASRLAVDETTLDDWLLRLEAGGVPIVVDRLTVRSLGFGPATLVRPSTLQPPASGPVVSALDPLGLVALPLGGLILITGKQESLNLAKSWEAWEASMQSVSERGSDATDRFQSPARWRGEMTPKGVARAEVVVAPFGGPGWRSSWIVSTGWPSEGATVILADLRAGQSLGWCFASAILAAGVLARTLPAKVRGFGLGTFGAMTTIGLAYSNPSMTLVLVGITRGLLAVLAFWVGRCFRGPRVEPRGPAGQDSTAGRRGWLGIRVVVRPALGLAIGLGLALTTVIADTVPDEGSPILVLMPFDGPAGPGVVTDRVVLLLKDRERLENLGRDQSGPPKFEPLLVSAEHRITRAESDLVRVDSRYEVEAEGPGPASWTFPIGRSMDLSATVDDRPIPLAVGEDGTTASLRFEGGGRRVIVFRRFVPLEVTPGRGRRVRVPISRAAFARVFVAKSGKPSWVDVVSACGDISVEPGGLAGILGPLEFLEIRWFSEAVPPPIPVQGPLEATSLWDARPFGDMIKMRLAFFEENTSEIRVTLEPGLVVRRHSIPDVVSVRVEGTEGRPEWVARVDPPLPKGAAIEIVFWKAAVTGAEVRQWPAIDVPSAPRFTNLIGFRRPSDWSGRLEPGPGGEPALEAVFAKAWGVLSDDGLTLAGAIRSTRSAVHSVPTSPVSLKRSITTRVLLGLSPGRLDVSILGDLVDRQGRSFEVEVTIPAEFRIDRVDAVGLVDWQRISRERLRLQFDGQEASARQIRVDGHIPAPPDSIRSETRIYQVKVPWPRWGDAVPGPGTLEITSLVPFRFEPSGKGLLQDEAAIALDGTGHSSYKIEPDVELPPIRWTSPPARVDVSIENELMIVPNELAWTASLTCQVSGGPAESLHWKLPTEWARVASLEIEGMSHRLVSQPEGPSGDITRWAILPGEPIWGRARLIIRARLPFRRGKAFEYPHLSPMATTGRGSVARYDLAMMNRSGDPIEVAGSARLQQIDPTRSFPIEAYSNSTHRSFDRAYQVTGDPWSLRLRVGKATDQAANHEGDRPVRVTSAIMDCILSPNREVWGRAIYHIAPRPGPFLKIYLPGPGMILWAGSDDSVRPILTDKPNHWIIPLGEDNPRCVVIAWHYPVVHPEVRGYSQLDWPIVDNPPPSTLFNVELPEQLELSSSANPIQPTARFSCEVEGFESSSMRVIEALRTVDLERPNTREVILRDLVALQLQMRGSLRERQTRSSTEGRLAERIQESWNSVVEGFKKTGQETLINEALSRMRLAQPDLEIAQVFTESFSETARIRRSDQSKLYRLDSGETKDTLRVGPINTSKVGEARREWTQAIFWFGGLLWIVLGVVIARDFAPSIRQSWAILLLLWITLATGGPFVLLATPTFLAWGWTSS